MPLTKLSIEVPATFTRATLASAGISCHHVSACLSVCLSQVSVGRNRSKRGRDMAIFRFFQDGGHPPSWICYVCSDNTRRAFGGLYRCAKFGTESQKRLNVGSRK